MDVHTTGPTRGIVPSPAWLIQAVEAKLGQKFTLDVAASAENAKAPTFFTAEQDGLLQSWQGHIVWCNPPFNSLTLHLWCRKAFSEAQKGAVVACLLPLWHGTDWYSEYVISKAQVFHVRGFARGWGKRAHDLIVAIFRPGQVNPQPLGHITKPGFDTRRRRERSDRSPADYEWQTPTWIIEGAGQVMGMIDLDPCSSSTANEAELAVRRWSGNIFLKLPFDKGQWRPWLDKLRDERRSRRARQAVVVGPNTLLAKLGSRWFQFLLGGSLLIPYRGTNGNSGLKASVFIAYLGKHQYRFANVFSERGIVVAAKTNFHTVK